MNRYDALGLSATVDLNAQAFWKDIEKRLNDDLKYEWTARFLNKSLQTNFDRRNAWEYSERPSLGKEIQGTSEYQVDVRNLIDNAVPNAPHVNQQSQLKYKNGDLHAAIEVANVRYRGKICKRKKNKWTWELKVNVSGRFDYQEWRFADIPNFDTKLAGLYSDAIVAFDWETNFEENGSRIIR